MRNEDENEMVTISYEVPLAYANTVAKSRACSSVLVAEKAACIAALDARKSKYDLLREVLGLPWKAKQYGSSNQYSVHFASGGYSGDMRWQHGGEAKAQLMAAAPLLLEALISLRAYMLKRHGLAGIPVDAHEAIKSAVPADVAAELISGDGR